MVQSLGSPLQTPNLSHHRRPGRLGTLRSIIHCHSRQILQIKFGAKLSTNFDTLKWAARRHEHVLVFLEQWKFISINLSYAREMLQWAAKNGSVGACRVVKSYHVTTQYFLQHVIRFDDNNASRTAASFGHVEVLEFFRTCGLSLWDIRDNDNAAFRMAAAHGHLNVLQYLRDWKPPVANPKSLRLANLPETNLQNYGVPLTVNDICAESNYALRFAAFGGHVDVFQFLINWRGADGSQLTVEDMRDLNNRALHAAAAHGRLEILKIMKDYCDSNGDKLTLKDVQSNENHALQCAAREGHLEVCRFLLDWIAELQNKSD